MADAIATDFETVIGLECHVELSTETKMFCGCRNTFGAPPNTNVCPICLGLPGSMPVPNEKAIEYIVRIGLAMHCRIAPESLFHRKNYFYPDMPKNFQISQYDLPVCVGGHLDIEVDGEHRRIGITRVHMEEDTGKTQHSGATGRIADAEYALVDYNRAGVPLVEIVSEPDLRSPDEARAYVSELRATLEALDVSDVRMEEGSLRCDANISVRPRGSDAFGVKVEIKNLNSIRSLERALRYEIERQTAAVAAGGTLVQETRHWEEDAGRTKTLRSKEEAFDYRYFPEPDLPPLQPDVEWVKAIEGALPELPAERRAKYQERLELPADLARLLAESRDLSGLFESLVERLDDVPPRTIANWIVNEPGTPGETRSAEAALADAIRLVVDGVVSQLAGKEALQEARETGKRVHEIVEERGLRQVSDADQLGDAIDEVIAEHPGPVAQFRGGKDPVIGFLVGQVIRKTGGAANPKVVHELLRERLAEP